MRKFISFLTMMTTASLLAQNGKATTTKTTFSRETSVSIRIDADAAILWTLLTQASDYPRWNSTILSLEGEIAEGEKITLKSTLDSSRTFTLKVKELLPEERMVWGDGKGTRTYTLSPNADGSTTFHMHEKIGGLMFPLYAKYIPPFDENFEQFAADLKKEAELINRTK